MTYGEQANDGDAAACPATRAPTGQWRAWWPRILAVDDQPGQDGRRKDAIWSGARSILVLRSSLPDGIGGAPPVATGRELERSRCKLGASRQHYETRPFNPTSNRPMTSRSRASLPGFSFSVRCACLNPRPKSRMPKCCVTYEL